jgi:hypothetical protein
LRRRTSAVLIARLDNSFMISFHRHLPLGSITLVDFCVNSMDEHRQMPFARIDLLRSFGSASDRGLHPRHARRSLGD